MRFHLFKKSTFLGFVIASFFLSGCSLLYPPLGKTLTSYGRDKVIGHFFSMPDIDMLCMTGSSLFPLMGSFERVGVQPDYVNSPLVILSSFCKTQEAHRFQIQSLIADQAGNYQASMSFAALQKRALAQAAQRQLSSYTLALSAYPKVKANNCPDFATPQDELVFLLANISGVEAIINDSRSGLLVNIPRNVVNHIYRNMDCLSSQRWWGTPEAVQASLLVFLPNLDTAKSTRIDSILWDSIKQSRASGVLLSEAVAIVAWQGQAADNQIERLIGSHYKYLAHNKLDPRYLAISGISSSYIDWAVDIRQLQKKQPLSANPAEVINSTENKTIDTMELELDDL